MTNESPIPTKIEIGLEKNIQLCLEVGFGTLVTAQSESEYRIAIIFIHNGLELLMKLYLTKKDKFLIYDVIDHKILLHRRSDLRENVVFKNINNNTISFFKCMELCEYFSNNVLTKKSYITKLNKQRNSCVHYEYSYYEKDLRNDLISHIYELIAELISEMELNINDFIPKRHTDLLDEYKEAINNEIRDAYLRRVANANKHYNEDLTMEEKSQKTATEDYNLGKFGIIVECPACKNNALLMRGILSNVDKHDDFEIIKRDVILKSLSCHYCGLSITVYDQLKIKFDGNEKSLPSKVIPLVYPDDCPPEDCPDDCPPEDCYHDCPDDCYHDCPDDCYHDCPDDCPPEDCYHD